MARSNGGQSSTRLPATRESRPALIGLAIILIVGGALASAYLAIQAGHRSYYVMVKHDVAQGAELSVDDLTQVSLPEDFQYGIPADEGTSVVGKSAAVQLLGGTILTPQMVSNRRGLGPNQGRVSFAVDSNSVVSGLEPGARVAVSIASVSGGSPTTVAGDLVASGPAASSSGLGTGGSQTSLTVDVDQSCVGPISQGSKSGDVTVGLIGASNKAIGSSCPVTSGSPSGFGQ